MGRAQWHCCRTGLMANCSLEAIGCVCVQVVNWAAEMMKDARMVCVWGSWSAAAAVPPHVWSASPPAGVHRSSWTQSASTQTTTLQFSMTNNNENPLDGTLSRTTRVSWYQKINVHSPHIYVDSSYGRPMEYGRPLYFCPVVSIFLFFSSPILSGERLDVYHTSIHDVVLVQV